MPNTHSVENGTENSIIAIVAEDNKFRRLLIPPAGIAIDVLFKRPICGVLGTRVAKLARENLTYLHVWGSQVNGPTPTWPTSLTPQQNQ